MSECVKEISNEDIKNYWKSFFEEKMSVKDINDMLETVSNTNLEKLIEENKTIDTCILDSLIWKDIKNENLLQEILIQLKEKCYWIYFFEPILKKYFDNFVSIVKETSMVYNIDLFLLDITEYLINQLDQIAYQTLIVELYYSKANNLLKGTSKETRGKYFTDILLKNDEYRKEIYLNYPELTRLLDLKVKYGIEFIIKIVIDTQNEISNIESYINKNNKLGKIKTIYLGEGDTHNKGKSVAKLVFESNKIIIYKPHKLDIDKKYYDFIQWINNLRIIDNLKENLLAVNVYSIKDAGWSEFIEYIECDNQQNIEDFYYKIGRILCLLHTLNGNDMHNENIIAHKDMPVLIDLETLIHADISTNRFAKSSIEIAMNEVIGAVTNTHLLPSKIVNAKNNKVLEIGGLGAYKEQESPFKGKYIENYGTDEVKILKRYGKILPRNNNPIYNNELIDANIYIENIISGFKDMYKWIVQNKDIYVNKVETIFNNCDIRTLYRGTNVYAQLLITSFHPDLLTNYADRYIFLHRIAKEYKNGNEKIIRAEINDMVQGDIPHFTINSDEINVEKLNENNEKNIYKNSTIENVLTKINDMSEIKMYRQIVAINTSFMTENYQGHIESTVAFKNNSTRKYSKDLLLNKATEISNYILTRSIKGSKLGINSRTWLETQDIERDLGFKIYDNASANLYSGLSGIALLYNYLWKVSKNNKYKEVAEETISSILETFPKDLDNEFIDKLKPGAFNGLGGIAYSLFYIDYSNNTDLYVDYIIDFFNIINRNMDKNNINDIINGAGNLGIMISIYEKTQNEYIKKMSLDIAKKIFVKLDETKIQSKEYTGVYWGENGFIGYSHGNSGIIAQLYRLYAVTNEIAVLNLVEKALSYERAMFSTENSNWYKSLDKNISTCGWCHGSAGILLSKLQLKNSGYEDNMIDSEILFAIQDIKNNGLNNDISLCHGDVGNMIILKEAAILLQDNELYKETVATIEEVIDYILELIKTESFKEREYNGFMVGLSGIAYEILRLEREYEIPNILGLE